MRELVKVKCPLCGRECFKRGLKSHLRLKHGQDGSGPKLEVKFDYRTRAVCVQALNQFLEDMREALDNFSSDDWEYPEVTVKYWNQEVDSAIKALQLLGHSTQDKTRVNTQDGLETDSSEDLTTDLG